MTTAQIYKIARPAQPALPLVFDSPHSGRIYPADFDYACPFDALQRAEDNDVDALLDYVPDYRATLLCALFPRTYIDVNRAEDDIDRELLDGDWPAELPPSSRSAAGIGLIRRLVKPAQPVYSRKLSVAEIRYRLDRYYHPYHAALKTLLDDAHRDYGQVWHINCHSMPGISLPVSHGILNRQADFVLGDRDGTSCALEFTHFLRDSLRNMGYKVAINTPYKGVEIVRRSAAPAQGRHSIQLEISKTLYWDDYRLKRTSNFKSLKDDLEDLTKLCAAYVTDNLVSRAAD